MDLMNVANLENGKGLCHGLSDCLHLSDLPSLVCKIQCTPVSCAWSGLAKLERPGPRPPGKVSLTCLIISESIS